MKKLTEGRRALVELAIKEGKVALDLYRKSGLSTFTEEGRKLVKPYWQAQEDIMDVIDCSVTRACELIDGKATLDMFYDAEGNFRKVQK